MSSPDSIRLAAELSISRLDAPLDRLARLATRLVNVPIAMVSFANANHPQNKEAELFVVYRAGKGRKAGDAPPDPRLARLAHLLRQRVSAAGAQVVANDVDDAPRSPPADAISAALAGIDGPHFRAYAAVPLISSEGGCVGALSLVDTNRRRWHESELAIARELSRAIVEELEAKSRFADALAIAEREIEEQAEELRAQAALFHSVLDHIGDGVLSMDKNRRFLVVNPAAQRIFGSPDRESLPLHWPSISAAFMLDGVTPFPADDGPLTRSTRGESLDNVEFIVRPPGHDGPTYLNVTARPILDARGEITAGVAVFRDVTTQKKLEQESLERHIRYRLLSEAAFEGIAMSEGGIIRDNNRAYAEIFGYAPGELLGRSALDLIADGDRERVTGIMRAASDEAFECEAQRKDGGRIFIEVRPRQLEIEGRSARMVVVRDVTKQKRDEALLAEQAATLRTLSLRDELTGLYNRRGFLELAGQHLKLADRSLRAAALFFADLNGMKSINDQFGHTEGDRALVDAAALLRETFRATDVVARLGGDEFVALAVEIGPPSVESLRARLRAQIAEFNVTRSRPYRLSLSVGVAEYDPRSPQSIETLLGRADSRMYEQKRRRHLFGTNEAITASAVRGVGASAAEPPPAPQSGDCSRKAPGNGSS